jgi:ferrous iron transport protein B
MVMLVQALGTTHIDTVMSTSQLLTFTLFVVFYLPCVATVAVLGREMGWRDTAWISGLTIAVATVVALAGRVGFAIFG